MFVVRHIQEKYKTQTKKKAIIIAIVYKLYMAKGLYPTYMKIYITYKDTNK